MKKMILVFFSLLFVGIALSACSLAETLPAEIAASEATSESEENPSTALPIFTVESITPGEERAYSFLSSSGEELRYLIYFPVDYVETKKWPLIQFLHGSGGRGSNIDTLRGKTLLRWIEPDMEFPFIVVSPQIPSGGWPQYIELMDELLDHLALILPIDVEALFLTGNSLGGIGSWHYAMANPTRFAAVVPIAGGPVDSLDEPIPERICSLREVPVWVFHGSDDRIVPVEENVVGVEALETCGSSLVKFTIYEGGGHGTASRLAYSDPALYEWMLEQVR